MHPEILSLTLFMFVTSCSPGPNNVIASHSGFNHGIKKSIPLMMGVIFGFTTMLAVMNFGLINIFDIYPIIQKILIATGTIFESKRCNCGCDCSINIYRIGNKLY